MRASTPISSPWAMISLGRVRGDGDAVRVRQFGQQRLAQRDLRQQVGLAHRVLGRGQQRQRQQVDRVDVGGAVDVDLDLLRQRVDRVRQPRRLLVVGHRPAVPVGRVLGQHVVEADRLAEVHHHLAVVRAQHLGDAAQQLPRSIPSPWACPTARPGSCCPPSASRSRCRPAGTAPAASAGAGSARTVIDDHAALGRQQAAGARAPALDEVLDRIAAGRPAAPRIR